MEGIGSGKSIQHVGNLGGGGTWEGEVDGAVTSLRSSLQCGFHPVLFWAAHPASAQAPKHPTLPDLCPQAPIAQAKAWAPPHGACQEGPEGAEHTPTRPRLVLS